MRYVRAGAVLLEKTCLSDFNHYDWLTVFMAVDRKGVKKADVNRFN